MEIENEIIKSPVLKIEHLSKKLGKKQILSDVNLEIYPGEVFGFLGPNGAGKTTTIKVALGLLKLESGKIEICGHDISTEFEAALENVGSIIENPEMYRYLTGRENLDVYRRMYHGVPAERVDEVIKTVHLEDRIDERIGKYSLGMRQRLGVAQAILSRPKLLILDEPTNGLDPVGIKELRETLLHLAHEEGMAVFISSHQLAELDLLCDRVCIIDRGHVIGTETIEEIRCAGQHDKEFTNLTFVDAQSAKAFFDERGIEYTQSGDTFRVTTAAGTIQYLIKELCRSDVLILSAVPVKHTIEEAFLAATTPFGEEEKNNG